MRNGQGRHPCGSDFFQKRQDPVLHGTQRTFPPGGKSIPALRRHETLCPNAPEAQYRVPVPSTERDLPQPWIGRRAAPNRIAAVWRARNIGLQRRLWPRTVSGKR